MTISTDTIYRVVRIPDTLRDAIRNARDSAGKTNATVVAEAVNKQLPKLLEGLRSLGFGKFEGELQNVRLPFSYEAGTLAALKDASE